MRFRNPLLALLSSALYVASYPGRHVELGFLAFVAYVPLIIAIRDASPKRALALGWLSGGVTTIVGFRFILPLLERFSGFGEAACVFLLIGLGGLHGARTGVHAWLVALAPKKYFALAFVLGFAVAEAFVPAVFAWRFAATMHAYGWLWQILDIGGPIGLGAVIALTNAGVGELVLAKIEKRKLSRELVGVAAFAPFATAFYGFLRLHEVDKEIAHAPTMKVGLVQGNVPLLLDAVSAPAAIVRQAAIADDLAAQGAELLVWSEAAIPYPLTEGTEAATLAAMLGPNRPDVPTLLGVVIESAPGTKPSHENNTALLVRNGVILGRYDKQDLLAFSEFLPLGDVFPILYEWSPASAHFVPGVNDKPIEWTTHTLGVVICYEDVVASRVRGLLNEAPVDLLVNLTNDAWFGDGDEPIAHVALASMRSVEERRTLVRATNTGLTTMIDPRGYVTKQAPASIATGLMVEAPLLHVRTLYARIGEAPSWLALFALIGLIAKARVAGSHTRDSDVADRGPKA